VNMAAAGHQVRHGSMECRHFLSCRSGAGGTKLRGDLEANIVHFHLTR